MVNKSMVVSRLAFIEDALKEMNTLGSIEKEGFLRDKTKVAAVESYLRRSLEALFDVGRHVLVHSGWHEYSMEYKSIAKGMVEKRIVSECLQDKLQQIAGYRNRLVHFYHEITPKELYQIIQEDIGDIGEIVKEIKEYIVNMG
jgi:uncharacterized protein YutE (UPF0331/DUF86 family)